MALDGRKTGSPQNARFFAIVSEEQTGNKGLTPFLRQIYPTLFCPLRCPGENRASMYIKLINKLIPGLLRICLEKAPWAVILRAFTVVREVCLDWNCCWNKTEVTAAECPYITEGEEELYVSQKRRVVEKCLECPRFADDVRRHAGDRHPSGRSTPLHDLRISGSEERNCNPW